MDHRNCCQYPSIISLIPNVPLLPQPTGDIYNLQLKRRNYKSMIVDCISKITKLENELSIYNNIREEYTNKYHKTDRKLAMLDGRYKVINSKTNMDMSKGVGNLNKDQILYLTHHLERLMEVSDE